MTDEHTLGDGRAGIERRLERALDSTAGKDDEVARAAVEQTDDRWYGRVLIRTVRSVTDAIDTDPVLTSAAAIELLRTYCRLRIELLVPATDDVAQSPSRDPTSTLLAADHLQATAYSVLGAIDHPRVGACFETLTSVSKGVVEGFAAGYVRSPPAPGGRSSVGEVAGTLGEGATVVGATLAGVDGAHVAQFATLGRELGRSRRARRLLDSDDAAPPPIRPDPDENALRRDVDHSLTAVDDALDALSPVADVHRLRPLVAALEARDE